MSAQDSQLSSLRSKYSDDLATLNAIFPSWSDDDLLLALDEAKGNVDLAATRVSEGERFFLLLDASVSCWGGCEGPMGVL
jgi:hypothetical protein